MTETPTHKADRLAAIRDIAADVFSAEPAEVEVATDFAQDLEADSLLVIELVSQLEKRFGASIRDDELPRMTNLKNTYEVVAESAGWAER